MSEKIDLSKYVLSEDDEFMNASQRAYFRAKLVAWKNDILREARETLGHLAEESALGERRPRVGAGRALVHGSSKSGSTWSKRSIRTCPWAAAPVRGSG